MKRILKKYKKHVSTSLLVRQGIYLLIMFSLLTLSIADVIRGTISFTLVASGFIASMVLGIVLSRMTKIMWHPTEEKVVSRIDAIGIIFFILYGIFKVVELILFKKWLPAYEVEATSFAVLSGLLLGRFLGIYIQVRTILHQKNKLH